MNQRNDYGTSRPNNDFDSIDIDYIMRMVESTKQRISMLTYQLEAIEKVLTIDKKIKKCFTWNKRGEYEE